MPPAIRVGIDTGGTFTDVVAVDERTGRLVTTKTPSTPADPAQGFMTGLHRILDRIGAGADDVEAISHGTTVATNRLLEGKIDDLGFITTEGYEHILEIARQSVPDGYGNSYFWVKPPRIVPADRVRTVGGRLAFDGSEIRPFDEDDAVAAARFFRDRGISAIGVCFLHAYADPRHEQRMRDVLAREHPSASVSISSQVLREYREYERSVTTLVDAAVKPAIATYVRGIRDRLAGVTSGESVAFYVMKSNGGVLSADEVVDQPISTVLSGPAAGALGAAVIADAAGFDRVLTLDGGGTSTDVTVVLDGKPALTTEGSVGAYPSKIPMIDVVTVGSGGGSIAWISPERTLKVGPRSAGADPGPMCYGTGGREPTVTDAHVLLGRLPPGLLGGAITLDVAAVARIFDDLQAEAGAVLAREGFDTAQQRFVRTADLRYVGQAFEVRVDVPAGPLTPAATNAVAAAFHDEHRTLYGYDFRNDQRQPVEWVNLRVTGVGPIRRPEIAEIAPGGGAEASSLRPVYFDAWTDTAVFDRAALGAGDVVPGPAVIEEFGSTLPLYPGFQAVVDRFGNLIITRGPA